MSEPWERNNEKNNQTHVDLTAKIIVGLGIAWSMCLVSAVETARSVKKCIKSKLTR